jgi:hypothetical protein
VWACFCCCGCLRFDTRKDVWSCQISHEIIHTNSLRYITSYADTSEDPDEARENAIRAVHDVAAKSLYTLASQCLVRKGSSKPWDVRLINEDDAKLPLVEDRELVDEFFDAGPRKVKLPKFKEIAAEALDYGCHVHKAQGHVEYTFCMNEATRCQVCKEILLKRQGRDPTWHPTALLAPLAKHGYYLP